MLGNTVNSLKRRCFKLVVEGLFELFSLACPPLVLVFDALSPLLSSDTTLHLETGLFVAGVDLESLVGTLEEIWVDLLIGDEMNFENVAEQQVVVHGSRDDVGDFL